MFDVEVAGLPLMIAFDVPAWVGATVIGLPVFVGSGVITARVGGDSLGATRSRSQVSTDAIESRATSTCPLTSCNGKIRPDDGNPLF
jgi:hypothetical protein